MANPTQNPSKQEDILNEATRIDRDRDHDRGRERRVERVERAEREAPGYREENSDFTPSPFWQSGTVSTSDTAGSANNDVSQVSPVFEEGRRITLETAARAIDPDDDTPAELVVLPEGSVTVSNTAKTADEGRDEIHRALDKVQEAQATRTADTQATRTTKE